jgi:hypothetical protein
MENPVQLQLAPWGPATNYRGAVKAGASVLPNRPACSAAITGARRVRHVPVRNLPPDLPARRCRSWQSDATCPVEVQPCPKDPVRGLPAMTAPALGSLEHPADRSRELGVSGILTT